MKYLMNTCNNIQVLNKLWEFTLRLLLSSSVAVDDEETGAADAGALAASDVMSSVDIDETNRLDTRLKNYN